MAQFWDSTQEHAFAQNNLLSLRVVFSQGGNMYLSLFLEFITCGPNLELHYPLKSNKKWKARLYPALNSKSPSKTFIHYTQSDIFSQINFQAPKEKILNKDVVSYITYSPLDLHLNSILSLPKVMALFSALKLSPILHN